MQLDSTTYINIAFLVVFTVGAFMIWNFSKRSEERRAKTDEQQIMLSKAREVIETQRLEIDRKRIQVDEARIASDAQLVAGLKDFSSVNTQLLAIVRHNNRMLTAVHKDLKRRSGDGSDGAA